MLAKRKPTPLTADGRRSTIWFSIRPFIPPGWRRRALRAKLCPEAANSWSSESAPASNSSSCLSIQWWSASTSAFPCWQIARQRVKRKNLANVKALLAMDAGAMTFEPARFDCVLAPYVMSVVPDPQLVLDQIWRVLRPGGELVIANHFWAETGPRGWFEVLAGPMGELARLAPRVPLRRGRRLGFPASRRVVARTPRGSANEALYAAEDRQAGVSIAALGYPLCPPSGR